MLLLTLNEWIGPSMLAQDEARQKGEIADPGRKGLTGMATRLPLAEALNILDEYQKVFRQRYRFTAVELELIAVSVIDDLSDDSIRKARIDCIIETHLSQQITLFREEIADREAIAPVANQDQNK